MQILINIVSYLGIILWVFGAYLAGFSHLRSMVGRAVVIIWHKKYLLFLAFFAGLSAYGGEINFLFRKLDTVSSLQGFLEGIRATILNGQFQKVLSTAKTLWMHNTGILSGYVVATLIAAVVVAWLIIISQAAIVRIIGRYQQDKPTGIVDGLTTGWEKFWMLVTLNIFGLLAGWSAWVILTGIPAAIFLITHIYGWSVVAYIGSLTAIVISAIAIFLIQFATANITLRDMKLMPAVVESWRLFAGNILNSLEMAIAVFTINLTFSFLVIGEALAFISPFTIAGFIAVVIIIVLLYAILSAFSFSVWTVFYLRLVDEKTPSKLGQWTTKIVNFAGQKRITS